MLPNAMPRLPLAALLSVPVIALAGCAEMPTAAAPDAASLAVAQSAPSQPVRLTFHKCPHPDQAGVWVGSVSGDIAGDLVTTLTGARAAGPILHVHFDWDIAADDPARSFRAELSGTLNTRTGRVIMNGNVAEGYLQGARVHEEGQPAEGEGCFEGTIRIMPATAS